LKELEIFEVDSIGDAEAICAIHVGLRVYIYICVCIYTYVGVLAWQVDDVDDIEAMEASSI